MSNQVTFTFEDALKRFGKSMEDLSAVLTDEVNTAIKNISHATFAAIQSKAQSTLTTTRQDYLKGLSIVELGDNSYLISLDGDWPNALEGGFGAYDQKPGMLNSQKTVSVGARAGQPWVRQTKDRPGHPSHRYAYVPFERNPSSKAPQNADMAAGIKSIMATNLQGVEQKITQLFKDDSGSPLQGKVAIGKSDNPLLNNLVKYQKTIQLAGGKEVTRSTYLNYRTVSEEGGGWLHPGYAGIRAFADAEARIPKHLDDIITKLFGG